MVVGKVDVDIKELVRHTATFEEYRDYCATLIPSAFRHVSSLVDNQCYVCFLKLRNSKDVSWDFKKSFGNEIMRKISVTGIMSSLIEAEGLLQFANIERVQAFKKGEESIECKRCVRRW